MIDEIHVSNLALIQEATLLPSTGLTVLTGETGAGKTALLSALKLLMGARASADAVRDGADELSVAGRFYGAAVALDTDECTNDERIEDECTEDECVVVRRVNTQGRSRITLNGVMASNHELAQRVGASIDLCGQMEYQQLMKPTTHVKLLDAWAASLIDTPLKNYQLALSRAEDAAEQLARIREAQQLSDAKLDEARFDLGRIDSVSPVQGEYEQLCDDVARAEHAEELASAIENARQALSGDGGALDSLGVAARALESVQSVDTSLGQAAQTLREAGFLAEDAAAAVRNYRDRVEFDPQELEQWQERVAQLQGLMRSYGPRMQDVFAHREQAAETLSLVEDASVRIAAAEKALQEAEADLLMSADTLDAARAQAAPQFEAEVKRTMDCLAMNGARLVCGMERMPRQAWTAEGPSTVEFMYCPAEGMQERPLARIASGGEMSRVMLSIKVALGAVDSVDTLVFDEVDAGVGGATARALADVLAGLAKTHQVLAVTHLAQVAARADKHYVVNRSAATADCIPQTGLIAVTGDQREKEIARMLSGTITDASRAHARELLEGE